MMKQEQEILLVALYELHIRNPKRLMFSLIDIINHGMTMYPEVMQGALIPVYDVISSDNNTISHLYKKINKDEVNFYSANFDFLDVSKIDFLGRGDVLKPLYTTALSAYKTANNFIEKANDLEQQFRELNLKLPTFKIKCNPKDLLISATEIVDLPHFTSNNLLSIEYFAKIRPLEVFNAIAEFVIENKVNNFSYSPIIKKLHAKFQVKKEELIYFFIAVKNQINLLENIVLCCKYIPFYRTLEHDILVPARFFIPLDRPEFLSDPAAAYPEILSGYQNLIAQIKQFQKSSLSNIFFEENGKIESAENIAVQRKGQIVDKDALIASVKNFLQLENKKSNTIIMLAFLSLYDHFNVTTFSVHQVILAINPSFSALKIFEDCSTLPSDLIAKVCSLDYLVVDSKKDVQVQINKEKKLNKDDFEFANEEEFNRVMASINNYFSKMNNNELIDKVLTILLPYCLSQQRRWFFSDEYMKLRNNANTPLTEETSLQILDTLTKDKVIQPKSGNMYEFQFTTASFTCIRNISPGLLVRFQLLSRIHLNAATSKETLPPSIDPPVIVTIKDPRNSNNDQLSIDEKLTNKEQPMDIEIVDGENREVVSMLFEKT